MSILNDYLTEPELLKELANRGIKRSKRWAQIQRRSRRGPPWALIGNVPVTAGIFGKCWEGRTAAEGPLPARLIAFIRGDDCS
jgi:hypothetical protein